MGKKNIYYFNGEAKPVTISNIKDADLSKAPKGKMITTYKKRLKKAIEVMVKYYTE